MFKHNYGKIFSLEKKLDSAGGNESTIQEWTQNFSFVALKIEKLQLFEETNSLSDAGDNLDQL